MRYIEEREDGENQAICKAPLQCLRCGNEKREMFGRFRSYTLQREIYYCRACLIFGRVSEKTRLSIQELQLPETFQYCFPIYIPRLTTVQQRCVEDIRHYIQKGDTVLDVVAVTGAGKTEMILTVASDFLKRQKCIAFVCPRIDVIRELYQRITRYFPSHLIIGWHERNHAKRLGHIYVMTVHQCIHYEDFFDLIVIDEADAYPFVGEVEDQMLRRFIHRALKEDGVQIYMTATPKFIHGPVVQLLTKFNQRALPTPQFTYVPHLKKRIRYQIKIKHLTLLKQGQWLVFVPSIEQGEELESYLKKYVSNQNVTFVYSEDGARVEKIDQFRQQELNILVTTSILERGVTFDDVSVAIFFPEHTLMTKEMIIQICGRVDRGVKEAAYQLLAYYGVFTDKIHSVSKQIKEMNDQREIL